MTTLKLILIALMALILTACSQKCEPQTRYLDKPVPYPVPVPCKIEPVICGKLIGNAIQKQDQSLKCIAQLRRSIEGCSK